MRGYSVIYCEGSSQHVSAAAAEILRRKGVIVPHPGAGADGINGGDWTLAEAVAWAEVYEVVAGSGDLRGGIPDPRPAKTVVADGRIIPIHAPDRAIERWGRRGSGKP